jgi:hypothetical protein
LANLEYDDVVLLLFRVTVGGVDLPLTPPVADAFILDVGVEQAKDPEPLESLGVGDPMENLFFPLPLGVEGFSLSSLSLEDLLLECLDVDVRLDRRCALVLSSFFLSVDEEEVDGLDLLEDGRLPFRVVLFERLPRPLDDAGDLVWDLLRLR